MIRKITVFGLLIVLLAGCSSLERGGATVSDGKIENSSLGFFGFSYEIPAGFELYGLAGKNTDECTELQQMAIRIYDVNKTYHPSGNETFYESFLMFSENVAFLLVTVEHDRLSSSGGPWEDSIENGTQRQLLPLYNISDSRRTTLGSARMDALLSSGRAFEKKGWYYPKPKKGSMEFRYKACSISGVNRDSYILMGFSLPEHEHILSLQMQEMIDGFRF